MAQLQAFVQGVVEDHFRLGRKLGQGGFATVYLATEKKTGIQRALKFFPIKDVTDDVVNECRYVPTARSCSS
jgi:serine/threonine protein kinase